MSDRKIILVDYDHTLTNAFWRDNIFVDGDKNTWDTYHAASIDDEPIHDVLHFVNAMADAGYYNVGITVRPEKWRQITNEWGLKHGVKIHELLMKDYDRWTPAVETKLTLINQRFDDPSKSILMALDDRQDVVEMYKSLGITAMQVHGRIR